jgi:hypothetical protein
MRFSAGKKKYRGMIILGGLVLGLTGAAAAPSQYRDVLMTGTSQVFNWTTLSLSTSLALPWQPAALDAAEKRVPIAEHLRRMVLASLQKNLLSLPIDGDVSVQDLMLDQENTFSYEVQNFIPELAYTSLPFHDKDGMARMGMEISLRGRSGFLSMLSNHFPLYEVPPLPRGQTRAVFHHSGLVVDARHLPFQPALGTRIFNASGDLVYGVAYTDRTVYVEDGHILFLSEHDDPRVTARAGSRFLLMVAKDVRGPLSTDLVLFDADSDRILASAITRSHLKRCRVVVICKSINK